MGLGESGATVGSSRSLGFMQVIVVSGMVCMSSEVVDTLQILQVVLVRLAFRGRSRSQLHGLIRRYSLTVTWHFLWISFFWVLLLWTQDQDVQSQVDQV